MLRGNKCAESHVRIIGEPAHPLLLLPRTDVPIKAILVPMEAIEAACTNRGGISFVI
jgi:hypothetical protein